LLSVLHLLSAAPSDAQPAVRQVLMLQSFDRGTFPVDQFTNNFRIELVRRAPAREWVRQNAVLLGAGTGPLDRLTVAALTLLIGEAGRELATCDDKAEAEEVIEAAVVLIRRLDPLTEDG
jgi:hypothetical protein